MVFETNDPVTTVAKWLQNFLTTNKGVQRLSWVGGATGGVVGALVTATQLRWGYHSDESLQACFIVAVASFVATWLLVRSGGWVAEGFKMPSKSENPPSSHEGTDSEK